MFLRKGFHKVDGLPAAHASLGSVQRLGVSSTMDYPNLPPNTFRPIQNAADLEQQQWGHLAVSCTRSSQVVRLSPLPSPLPPRSVSRLAKLGRQGSDNWSSATGSRQSSRPGSAVIQAAGSRPPSTHLSACRSGNSSATTDVSRNFQQLSVSTRRAAFKTQKWSHSFDQTCLMAATSASSPNGRIGGVGGAKRHQTSLQQKSLDLDSGYLGSPASSGLASHNSQSLAEYLGGQAQFVTEEKVQLPGGGGDLQLEGAKQELARLITTSQSSEKFLRSASLPSFPECFPVISVPENHHRMGLDYAQLLSACPEPTPAQEELDALDEEIKRIVGEVAEGSSSFFAGGGQPECLRPRPIRSSNPFMVASELSDRRAVIGQHGSGSIEGQVDEGVEEDEEEEEEDESSSSSRIMLAVVSTVTQTYETPRSLPMGQASLCSVSSSSYSKGSSIGAGGLEHMVTVTNSGTVNTVSTFLNPWEKESGERTAVVGPSNGGQSASESVRPSSYEPVQRAGGSPRFVFKKTSQFSGK